MSGVEVVIPSFNGLGRLRTALDALARQTRPHSVCIIDNGSVDGTVEWLARKHPSVRVLALERNLGFGAAVNRGVRSSDVELVVLLNNDAVAEPEFIAELLLARDRAGAGVVAGCLVDRDERIETLGVQVDRSLIAYDYRHGERWRADLSEDPHEPVLGPSGGAALFEREIFLAAGGFDERLFAYLEDVELAIRLRQAGVSLALAPKAKAVHEHSGTLGARSSSKNYLLGWGRGYLLAKHGAGLGVSDRLRGYAIDAVTYTGKAVIDRDLGSIRGRLSARSRSRATPQRAILPDECLLDLSTAAGLRRRLRRRS
jgi:GT2 family glycosyltransferase